jgi:pimeloyl-ACP methyl ester carboxylesterase
MPVTPGRRRVTAAFVGLVAACAAALAVPSVMQSPAEGSSPVAGPGAEAQRRPALAWKPCPGSKSAQCTKLRVPVDWAKPRSTHISLAIARLPAQDKKHRIGTLFFNPGGPGDGGVQYVVHAKQVFPPALLARFDLVAMDPRGVGNSAPVRCNLPVVPADITLFPRNAKEFRKLRDYGPRHGRSSHAASGRHVGHVDTISVARDHDALRRALGMRKVSWLGISYGTQVATNYAALFPHHTRAMVLDGALEHSGSEVSMLATEILTAEDAFNRFAAWCATADACALKGQDVGAVYDDLVARADKHPIPVPGALRPVTGADIRMGTPRGLLFKEPSVFGPELSWAALSRAIKAAVEGDASFFAQPPVRDAAPLAERISIACMDFVSEIRTWGDMKQRIELGRQLAPHLQGATEQWEILRCMGWPVQAANPFRRLDVRDVPTLIVNATHDPSTAYTWALGLAGQIRGSDLLTREGDGHTSFFISSPCVHDAIEAYLFRPQAAANRVCTS